MSDYEIDVQRASGVAEAPGDRLVAGWARYVLEHHRHAAALSVRLVGEDEGAKLNRTYRRREGATNVLSFPFEAHQLTAPPLIGDLVICAPVVEREAALEGKPAAAHYAHMVVHGVLHLLGHDHESPCEAARMQQLERDYLQGLGFRDPYGGEARGDE